MLIPAKDNKFNETSKNYVKYLELAYLNVPVIAPAIKPYLDLISTNQNGFLCSEKEDYYMHDKHININYYRLYAIYKSNSN